jgi:helix-turn-helix protein
MENAWDEAQETFRRRRMPAVRQHSVLARTDIGERVRELRLARGLSQRQAGGELISRSFMSRLESGERLLGVTVLQALTLSMPDVRFVIEAGELRIEELPRPTE